MVESQQVSQSQNVLLLDLASFPKASSWISYTNMLCIYGLHISK